MTGCELIAEERQRQVDEEGWTSEHDDQHAGGQLAQAGACYAAWAECVCIPEHCEPKVGQVVWPFGADQFKPKDRIRNLVRAGALIAAEIDRLQRAGAS